MAKIFDLIFTSKSARDKKIESLKQITADTAELKLRFDKFLNPNDVENTYKPMQKGQQIAPADNEDGMLNNPKPLNKKGGSNTYSGAEKSGQNNDDEMPVVKDGGDTVLTADDDSLEDYIEWVEPLQNEMESLAQSLNNLWLALNGQQTDFWNYVSKHAQGHLPPINSASQMADALKKLGLQDDYIVQPQTIYAQDGGIKEIILKITPKKK